MTVIPPISFDVDSFYASARFRVDEKPHSWRISTPLSVVRVPKSLLTRLGGETTDLPSLKRLIGCVSHAECFKSSKDLTGDAAHLRAAILALDEAFGIYGDYSRFSLLWEAMSLCPHFA